MAVYLHFDAMVTEDNKSPAQPPEDVLAVAEEFMAYLKENRLAGDTVPGIRLWWLRGGRDRVDPSLVEAAMEWLVTAGAVGARNLATGKRHYFGLPMDPPGGAE